MLLVNYTEKRRNPSEKYNPGFHVDISWIQLRRSQFKTTNWWFYMSRVRVLIGIK